MSNAKCGKGGPKISVSGKPPGVCEDGAKGGELMMLGDRKVDKVGPLRVCVFWVICLFFSGTELAEGGNLLEKERVPSGKVLAKHCILLHIPFL